MVSLREKVARITKENGELRERLKETERSEMEERLRAVTADRLAHSRLSETLP